jgi:hypothetical protein
MMKKKFKLLVGILVIIIAFTSCSKDDEVLVSSIKPSAVIVRVDTFTFISGGVDMSGIIHLPNAYDTNSDLPAIYLIDYTEPGYLPVVDEFEQVIDAVDKMPNFDALVVSLELLPNIETSPSNFQESSDVYKDMTSYVDSNYTNNTSRTFIGGGSEAGVVLMTLLNEDPEANVFDNYIATDSPHYFNNVIIDSIQNGNLPVNMQNKKLHFSFTTSNQYDVCIEMINSFEEAQYPWLTFESKYYNSTFPTTYPAAFAAGLEFVFE